MIKIEDLKIEGNNKKVSKKQLKKAKVGKASCSNLK